MSRVNGLITVVAALAAAPMFASCYNEASVADGDPTGVGGSSGVTNPSTTSGTNTGGADGGSGGNGSGTNGSGASSGSGGSASSANGGGGSSSSAQGGGGSGSGANGSGGTSGSGGSSGSGSSSTGSGGSSSTGSGGAPPAGQHCLTYTFTMPVNAAVPDGLTIYDSATDGFNTPYLRPNPWNATQYGSSYIWGIAADGQFDADCTSLDQSSVQCTVCRPNYAYIHVNVHVQYTDAGDPNTRWSCQTGDYLGSFELEIDGVPTGFAYEPWSDAPDGSSGCQYYFILPG